MRTSSLPVFFVAFAMLVVAMVGAKPTQRLGDECNWKKNCQRFVDGAGPAWANNEVTCAVPASNRPETCGAKYDNKNDFYGTCKAIGTLKQDEYGCPCGVHGAKCSDIAAVNRLFWPQNWLEMDLGSFHT